MDVGVRALKENLAEYLDRASGGERITVTERGRPKAIIGPLPGGDNVMKGMASGWISPPKVHGPLPPAPQRHHSPMRIQEMMDEDRGSD